MSRRNYRQALGKMLTTFPFQQGLFIDPFFFSFQRKERHKRKLYIGSHSMNIGPYKVATKMNSKSVDREDFKSEGQRWKKHLSSGGLVVNFSSDVFS
jgi:hypothetical protein